MSVPTRPHRFRPRCPKLLKRFGRDRRGVAAIEFAFVGIPFFLFVAAILELSLQLTGRFLLDRGTERVGRLVLTGQIQGMAKQPTAEEFKAMVCKEIDVFLDCKNLMVDLRTYGKFSSVQIAADMKDGSIDTAKLQYNLGAGDQINVLRTYYEWPWTFGFWGDRLKTPGGKLILSSVAAFRNEPF